MKQQIANFFFPSTHLRLRETAEGFTVCCLPYFGEVAGPWKEE